MNWQIHQQMTRLSDFIGKQVAIDYVNYGVPQHDIGELREVSPFTNVLVGGQGIPFLGYGCAIRHIYLVDPQTTLYFNPFIPANYDIRNDEDKRYSLVVESFGEAIANQQRDARIQADEAWKKRIAELDAAAKAKAPELIEGGVPFVKPELAEEWREYARKNSEDGYSAAVIEGTIEVLQALNTGKTPAEAEKECKAAETGFQMGCVAKGVAHFAPRGEEFNAYWNRQYLSEEEAIRAGGKTVNPAIITIQPKEETQ